MLYILNKATEESVREIAVLGSEDDDKAVLLVTDGVFLATEERLKLFAELDVMDFYADEEAVNARNIEAGDDVELLDHDGMAELMEDHDKVIVL